LRPWLPYIAPMLVFLALTYMEGGLVRGDSGGAVFRYPLVYAVKIALVAAVVWGSRSAWKDLRPWPGARDSMLAVVVGLAVTVLWVGLDRHYPLLPFVARRVGYDPTALPAPERAFFLAVRFLGLVAIVPLVEELFWRSFVMRWIVHQDFWKVPLGTVTPLAAFITSVLFSLEHPEWLPALLTGLAWAWLLRRTRSVFACYLSHAVANLALGIYVLVSGAWRFW